MDILTEYKQDNLRIINFYIQALETLYPVIKNFNKQFVDEVLLFALIISIEFKLGKLTSIDYENSRSYEDLNASYAIFNFSSAVGSNYWKKQKGDEPEEKSDLEKFYDIYLVNYIDKYHFYNPVYVFILTGYLNKEQLTLELNLRIPPVLPIEVSSFRSLMQYGFRDLTNEEFSNLTKRVLEFAEEGKYTIYEYSQISEFYYFFKENELIDLDNEILDRILLDGISLAKLKNESDLRIFETLNHFKKERKDQIIIDAIIKAHNDIESKKDNKKINKLITYLKENSIEGINEVFLEYVFKIELFQHLDPDIFFDTILKVDNKTIKELSQLLDDRYGSTNIGEYLIEDYKFVNAISTKLKSYLSKPNHISLQIYMLKELNISIDSVIQKLIPYIQK